MTGDILSAFLHDFLILFGIINVVGNIPHIAALASGQHGASKNRTFTMASLTALVIVLVFALFGHFLIYSLFDISFASFKVAGGIVVFWVAVRGVVLGPSEAIHQGSEGQEDLSFFSIAFPFLVGPGTMVTVILLMEASGKAHTAFVTLFVYASVLAILFAIPLIEKVVGKIIMTLVSRILYIFIAAKATTFIISGLKSCFG